MLDEIFQVLSSALNEAADGVSGAATLTVAYESSGTSLGLGMFGTAFPSGSAFCKSCKRC